MTTLPKPSILPENVGQYSPDHNHTFLRNPRRHGFRYYAKTGGLYLSRHVSDENFDFSAMLTKIPAELTPNDDILTLEFRTLILHSPTSGPVDFPSRAALSEFRAEHSSRR